MLRARRRLQEPKGDRQKEQMESGEGADRHGQRVEEEKEARSSSTAIQAGIGGFQACSRLTTTSCPSASAYQSGRDVTIFVWTSGVNVFPVQKLFHYGLVPFSRSPRKWCLALIVWSVGVDVLPV